MKSTLIGVVGAGQMGSGVAALVALKGFNVVLVDSSLPALEQSKATITKQLQRLFPADSTIKDVGLIINCISFQNTLSVLEGCGVVIEAIPEREELKQSLYQQLSSLLPSEVIIGTNTSSFPISELAKYLKNPKRFIGVHFMNPVLKMDLVEIIPGHLTDEDTLCFMKTFVKALEKTAVVSADQPGFIVNRLLIPMINQAFNALESNLASKEDIDLAMEKGAAFPMGPLKLADFIGLDTCLAIMETLNAARSNGGNKPSELLKRYVSEEKLGRKTREGVYKY
jgi:3-hydroxybutyryl-CoA dehydrogenase